MTYENSPNKQRCGAQRARNVKAGLSSIASMEAKVSKPVYEVKAEFFKVLGHPSRVRILEVLREGEQSVGELAPMVAMESSHLSQQLGVMRRANLVQARKEGSTVFYSVGDATLFELLDVARRIITSSLLASENVLVELRAEAKVAVEDR
jgi:DNA-binding transcriptional ArsR family regulator